TTASYLPSVFVPLVGLVFPVIIMSFLFVFLEEDEIV
uniref:Photosystem I reaction center subunit VIII n=1 Tax=Selaginella lyallii TaxID=137159 RepID=A0A481ZJX2_9TRAC|nr:photosystem I subunit VIII [Selaginella lyallii]QBL02115.1 photosystem I subunit VIII [Selaginella lyallii]